MKEPKLAAWASALEVDEFFLRDRWLSLQQEYPDSPILRYRTRSATKNQVRDLFEELTGPERERVTGYIHRIIEERKETNVHP